MKRRQKQKVISADDIALLADQGKDVSSFFTNSGRMMLPIQQNTKAAEAKSPIDRKRAQHE